MGHRSPAKLLRVVKRMTKFREQKRPVLTKICLPGIDIAPVYPKLSIIHNQTTNIPSLTNPDPQPVSYPQHATYQPQQEHGQPQPVKDQITKKQLCEMMDDLKKNLFKPP